MKSKFNLFGRGSTSANTDNANLGSLASVETTPLVASQATPSQTTEQTPQLPLKYRKENLLVMPTRFISQMVFNLGKKVKAAEPEEREELKKLLAKFEAIKRRNVENGGENLTEGFVELAYASPKFLSAPEHGVTPEFTRVLRVIEKWTSDEKAVKGLGNIKGVIAIANNLYRTWRDGGIREKSSDASRDMAQVLQTAENFIENNGQKWLRKLNPKDRPTLWYFMQNGMPQMRFTAKIDEDGAQKRPNLLRLDHPGFKPNTYDDSYV